MKPFRFSTVVVVSIMMGAVLSGCGKPKPPDLPTLHPCSITITIKGTPLNGASVDLRAVEKTKWFAGGFSNDKGIAEMFTQAEHPGVAVGEYIVIVSKEVGESNRNDPEATAPVTSFVAAKYANKDTSPLRCTVKEGVNQFSFDIEAP